MCRVPGFEPYASITSAYSVGAPPSHALLGRKSPQPGLVRWNTFGPAGESSSALRCMRRWLGEWLGRAAQPKVAQSLAMVLVYVKHLAFSPLHCIWSDNGNSMPSSFETGKSRSAGGSGAKKLPLCPVLLFHSRALCPFCTTGTKLSPPSFPADSAHCGVAVG